jgi:hypothetical protein
MREHYTHTNTHTHTGCEKKVGGRKRLSSRG